MNTNEIRFEERTDGEAINYEGSVETVAAGCKVSLRKDGVDVLARITELAQDDTCVGEVTGFEGDEPSLSIGTTIRFQQQHIFRCAA